MEINLSRILIVEDDRDLNNAYRIILEHKGYEVAVAFNGKEALDKLKQFQPDLIVLDLLMPIMGGLEFLERWRASKQPQLAKVLIFTNMENSPEVAEAYKLGAERCIIKSWTAPHNLAHVVKESLQGTATSATSKKSKNKSKSAG